MVPHQRAEAALHDFPRGNLSDLYPRWIGARELLLHHRDPYGVEVTREIQVGYYGRALDPSRPSDPHDQQAFAYPVYVVFFLAPFVNFPFQIIQAFFYGILVLIVAVSDILWFRVLNWHPSHHGTAVVIVLTIGSLQVIKAVELQQLTLVVAALLAVVILLAVRSRFTGAGILLACATVKPQLAFPIAAWLIFWSLSDWRRRRTLFLAFLVTFGILLGSAEWILPGWIPEFWRGVFAYLQYTHATSLFDDLTHSDLGLLLTAPVLLFTCWTCWTVRHEPERSPHFVFACALVLATTLVLIPTDSTYNQVLLLPGILLLAGSQSILSSKNLSTRILFIIAAITIFWPWIAALGLTVASFILPASRVQQAWAIPFYTSIAIPLAVLALLFQYAFQILRSGEQTKFASERS